MPMALPKRDPLDESRAISAELLVGSDVWSRQSCSGGVWLMKNLPGSRASCLAALLAPCFRPEGYGDGS
jgi:hypothetical protein